MGEDSVSNHTDDVNDANKEDNSDHNGDKKDKEYYYDNFNGDILFYDSDNHLIIEVCHPSDKVDEEDEDDEDSNIDEDNDEDSDTDEEKDNEKDVSGDEMARGNVGWI